jgi:hypothetical protein
VVLMMPVGSQHPLVAWLAFLAATAFIVLLWAPPVSSFSLRGIDALLKPIATAAAARSSIANQLMAWFAPDRWFYNHLSIRRPFPSERYIINDVRVYLMSDPQWSDEKLGGTGLPLSHCAAHFCLSMALTKAGVDMDPRELNQRIKKAKGYSIRGWLNTEAIERITDGFVKYKILRPARHEDIQAALNSGAPVIVDMLAHAGYVSSALIIGYDGRDYLVSDPADEDALPKPLSSMGSEILLVSVVERAQGDKLDGGHGCNIAPKNPRTGYLPALAMSQLT